MDKNIIIKNFCLSLVVFSLDLIISLVSPSFPIVIFLYIIYPLYILADTVILTRKYGFNYWIFLTSSCTYIIPVFLLTLIQSDFNLVVGALSFHIIYLFLSCIIGLVGIYIGKITRNNN